MFTWSDGSDGCPPHIGQRQTENIFNEDKQKIIGALSRTFEFLIPQQIDTIGGTPFLGPTIADCEKYNREKKDQDTDIMPGRNIGELPDWYSDARFAQQHFSGVNPTTIEVAKPEKIKAYVAEAERQGLHEMKQVLTDGSELLIQDYSYFREATGLKDNEDFVNVIPNIKDKQVIGATKRYACASVIIFQLHEDGRLHPLAITLDYRGSLENSITIFNRRLTPDDKSQVDEKDDWPWRYAKTCAQTADWARHEIAVHLTDTHMVEEAIIVATHRNIPEDHLLFAMVRPHWFRTLALNTAARELMVPYCVARLAGFGPNWDPTPGKTHLNNRVFKFVRYSYKNFDFQSKYIPNDLKKRGFDLMAQGVGEKYRNYPYATLMWYLWEMLHNFAAAMLSTQYKTDEDVQNDKYIAAWCHEIQNEGQVTTFPTITTVAQLVDALTMIIHIATAQHTAVNYLQEYYYDFIPSKPAALCTPLPKDLQTLQTYTEKELTAALPIGGKDGSWKDWLLSAQLPQLLSYKVDERYSLLTYAKCLWNVNKSRTDAEQRDGSTEIIKKAAAQLYEDLKNMALMVDFAEACQTPGTLPYPVLKPELTAISILI